MNLSPQPRPLPAVPHSCRPVNSGLFFENRTCYQAQSVLTGVVERPELPSPEQANDILAWAKREGFKQ